MPSWFKTERNTAARQNLLLLQRYVEAYAAAHGGYPATRTGDPAALRPELRLARRTRGPARRWPPSDEPRRLLATPAAARPSYTLKVMLTSGWSASFGPLPVLGQLTTTPGG